VLEILEQKDEALSAIELIERFKLKTNKTSVYRVLERLVNEGTLHSFKGKDGLQWFAKCKNYSYSHHADLHPHFQYRDCGNTFEFTYFKAECTSM
jgi:Fur family transcriptional regulator, ferric uptake regulator